MKEGEIMMTKIIYQSRVYTYAGISCGEYIYIDDETGFEMTFTPGQFDMLRAHGLIKEGENT